MKPILKEGKDILHISLASGLSGEWNAAAIAKEDLLERYKERNIILVDSLGASSGYGLLLDTALSMQKSGASLEEVGEWMEQNKLRLHHWFFSTGLTHYRRGGWISLTAAILGAMLNICPLMNMNDKGQLILRRKIRGKKNAIREIVSQMKEHTENGTNYLGKCFVFNSACLEGRSSGGAAD